MPKTTKADPEKVVKADAVEAKVAEEKAVETSAKTPAKRTPKAAAKPVEPVEEVIIQFAGAEWSVADLKEAAIAAYVADKHRRGSINKLALYVKPEERMAYYVVNDKVAGSVSFE